MATQAQINALTKIANNKTLPILSTVKFETGRMISTNLSTAIIIEDADIIETGFVNPAKLKKAGVATVQKHWGLVKLNDFTSEDWPEIPHGVAGIPVSEQTINAMIDALTEASTDETRPVLTTIELANNTVSSTDGFRLFTRKTDHALDLLIPREAVELVKMTKLTKDWTIGHDKEQLTLQNGRFTLVSRLIDGTYPDWRKLVPAKAAKRVTVKAALLNEALDLIDGGTIRLDLNGGVYVQDGEDRKSMIAVVKPESDITLNPDDMHVVMPLKGATGQILLNSRYVKDAAGKSEYIRFSFNEALAPVIVEGIEK